MRLIYNGPALERELWGRVFPKGQVVAVDDPALFAKALRLDGFTEATEAAPPRKRGRPRKVRPQDGENQ